MQLGITWVQESGYTLISMISLATGLLLGIKRMCDVFPPVKWPLSPLRPLLATIGQTCHYCTFKDILLCWSLLCVIDTIAEQDYSLLSFLGSLLINFHFYESQTLVTHFFQCLKATKCYSNKLYCFRVLLDSPDQRLDTLYQGFVKQSMIPVKKIIIPSDITSF